MKITSRRWSSFGCFKSVLKSRAIFGLCILLASLSGLITFHMIVLLQPSTLSSKPNTEKRVDNMCTESELKRFPNGTVDFRGFNNYTGYKSGCYVVPNIIHLIKFNQAKFTFMEVICINSILTNHKPPVLIIHTNMFRFEGRYWAAFKRLPEFHRVRIVYLSQPKSIFNFSLEGGYGTWHASDVARLRIIQKYGGIYLDSDVYVTQSLDSYRRFEFVVEWNYHMSLGTQVLLGHRDARILPLWLETYKQYNASLWYYNAGELPTKAVLIPKPELFHRVRDHFGTSCNMLGSLYNIKDWNWKEYPAIHLFLRHQGFEFNENSVFQFGDFPIRHMILEVMPDFLYPTLSEKESYK